MRSAPSGMQRRRGGRSLATLLSACLWALAGAGSARAAMQPVRMTLQPNLWLLNGDTDRQPLVPLVQRLAGRSLITTGSVSAAPGASAATRVAFPRGFLADTWFATATTGENNLLIPNPRNSFDPFWPEIDLRLAAEAGTLRTGAAAPLEFGGSLPVALHLFLNLEKDALHPFFLLDIPSTGALPLGSRATVTFAEQVSLLSIPVDGTAFARGWGTGRLTVRVPWKPPRPGEPPPGYFTVTSTGSRSAGRFSVVTPLIIDMSWGVGLQPTPAPMLGFVRLTVEGVTLPEPGAAAGLAALLGALGLVRVARGRRRGRA